MTAAIVHRTRQHRPRLDVPPARSATGSPRRSRLAVWAVAGTIGVVGISAQIALSGAGDVPASAAGTGTAPVAASVKARPGDSLWSIAAEHRGDVPIQRYVAALVSLNGGTSRIEAGQRVRLP